jgi:hypothetical protein
MRKTLTLLSLATIGFSAQAQMADYSVAPDFTATDIDGNTQHLYDYLDQGYTVFMDISAAWCAPCWAYHNSGALEDLYNEHGPSTADNRVMVLFVEGESTNSLAQITGSSSGNSYATFSQGDWTAGTPYPIIDNADIANDYQITYFPTIYKICPNRLVTEVGQISASDLWASAQDCLGAAQSGTNAALITYTGDRSACSEGSLDIPVKIQNLGTDQLTTADLQVWEGTNVIASQTWTGNLATYATANVTFNDVAYNDPSQLSVHLVTSDVDASDDVLTLPIAALPSALANITFTLTLDYFCSETTWKLKNSAGTTVESGGPYNCGSNGGGADANSTHTYNWTLPFDCYSLEIKDVYGDGLYSSGYGPYDDGSWNLVDGSGVSLWHGDPNEDINEIYFVSTTGGMKVDAPAGIEENELSNSLDIYPNPSNGQIYLTYNLGHAADVSMEVYNTQGQLVANSSSSVPAGLQSKQMDLSTLDNGVYFLNIVADGMKTARMITISK